MKLGGIGRLWGEKRKRLLEEGEASSSCKCYLQKEFLHATSLTGVDRRKRKKRHGARSSSFHLQMWGTAFRNQKGKNSFLGEWKRGEGRWMLGLD